MREGSSKRLGTTLRLQDSKAEAKSFFCNILPVSHYASRFYRLSPYQMPAKALKADILAEPYQNKLSLYIPQVSVALRGHALSRGLAHASSRVFTGCKLIQSP